MELCNRVESMTKVVYELNILYISVIVYSILSKHSCLEIRITIN